MQESDSEAPLDGLDLDHFDRVVRAAPLWGVTLVMFLLLVALKAIAASVRVAWRTGAATDLAVDVAAYGVGALLGAWLLRAQARARKPGRPRESSTPAV